MAVKGGWLERMSRTSTEWSGSSLAFALALGAVVVWLLTGPLFHYSDTWQLVINTGTSVLTFLMVFLIQRTQNKDSAAIHLKLNELVAALPGSSNRLIGAEELTEDEVKILRNHFRKLVELAKKDGDLKCSHSIEDAELDHARKRDSLKKWELAQPESGKKRRRRRAKPNALPDAEPPSEPLTPPKPV
jgi:low affinity Fe/Cu permease